MSVAPTTMNSVYASGQALAEFNVAAVFVLMPVFLLIPLVGKYIDLRHTAVQSARTVAWERTVWFERSTNGTDTVPVASTAPARSNSEVQRAAVARLLGNGSRPLQAQDWGTDMTDSELNPFWRDHRGDRLVTLAPNDSINTQGPDQPLPSTGYREMARLDEVDDSINGVLSYGNTIKNQIESLASSLGLPLDLPGIPSVNIFRKFHFEGFYAPVTRLPVNNVEGLASFGEPGGVFDDLNLVMSGQAALIADGWTAEGSAQFAEWVDDYVPTKALKPFLTPFQELASYRAPVLGVSLAPELAPGKLRIGYVHMGPVPTSDIIPACPDGLCSYEEN